MLLSSGDNFPHLIQKRRSQLGFVTYLLNYPRKNAETDLSLIKFGTTEVTNFVHDKLTPVQTGPEAHPSSFTMGVGSFSEVKRLGCGVNDPPTSSAEFKERVELYFYITFVPSRQVIR